MTAVSLEPGADGLRLSGPLTFDTVMTALQHDGRILEGQGEVVLDLAAVSRADSAGLALLVHWLRQAEQRGRRLRFVNVPKQLMAIARVSGVDGWLPLEPL